jgi:hypothetical protein
VKPKAAWSGPEWEDGMEWLRPNGMGTHGDGIINAMEIMDVDGFEWT